MDALPDALQEEINKKRKLVETDFEEEIVEFRELFQKTKNPTGNKMQKILARIKGNDNVDENGMCLFVKNAYSELLKEFPTNREFHIFSKITREMQNVIIDADEYTKGVAFYLAMTVVCECPERDYVLDAIKRDCQVKQKWIDEYVKFFQSEQFTTDFDVLAKILLVLNGIIYEDGDDMWNVSENVRSVASNLFVLFDCMKYR